MYPSFSIVPSQKIDPVKWDACVATSANGLIYAQFQYLNHLCTNWSALIIGDYQTVLPMPWRKKWGIRYYYAPPFIQQLGLIGDQSLVSVDQIKKQLSRFAWYGDIFWNDQNASIAETLGGIAKTNFVIDLRNSHDTMNARYSNDLHQNIQKALKAGLMYQNSNNLNKAIEWYYQQYGERFSKLSKQDFTHFTILCEELYKNQHCFIREVIHPSNKETLATALLLKDNKRIYLVVNAINEAGRKNSANHFLIDRILNEFSEQNLLLDFEGSELKGVSGFYKNFSPVNQPYFHYRHKVFPYTSHSILSSKH